MKTTGDIIAESRANWHVCARNLTTGAGIAHQAGIRADICSEIKLPILAVLMHDVQIGRLSLRQAVHVRAHHVGRNGSGQLSNFHLRLPIELYNLAVLMITVSDNTATNAIIELIGRARINRQLTVWGYPRIRLSTDKFDFPATYRVGIEHTALTTAADLTDFVTDLYLGRLLDKSHTDTALRIFKKSSVSNLVRLIPWGAAKSYASKTGLICLDAKQPVHIGETGFIITKSGDALLFAVLKQGPLDRRLRYSTDAVYRKEMAAFGAAMLRELG